MICHVAQAAPTKQMLNISSSANLQLPFQREVPNFLFELAHTRGTRWSDVKTGSSPWFSWPLPQGLVHERELGPTAPLRPAPVSRAPPPAPGEGVDLLEKGLGCTPA
jgi:hypothetical protein